MRENTYNCVNSSLESSEYVQKKRRNRVSGFKNHWATKWIALFLAVGLLWGGQLIFPRETGLEGLFKWAVKNYLEGKYWEVCKDLELLLSYCDEDHNELTGKIYLLLGAAYEQLGDIKKARQHYQLSYELLQNPAFDGIDLTSLQEYQRIIMKKQKSIPRKIIEKPISRPKRKKRIPLLYIIGGGALLVGLVVAFVLKKKVKPEQIDFVPDYDTRQLAIEWIRIPQGEFLMGDNFNEGGDNEQPVHAVYLDEYFISKYEVTFEQFDKYCEVVGFPKPDDNGWGRGNRPVINVTGGTVASFCDWLSLKTGKNIHLPTEAQWEKAARGTDQRRYPWGNSPPDCIKVNYDCDNQTHPVGSHPPGVSPYGLHDMAGNVSEWCRDGYSASFYANSPYSNPEFIPTQIRPYTNFIIRGGSWTSNHPMGIRCADRGANTQDSRSETLGFRLVMER
jgi:formylglycine-generating enzyme required for sulfatase activity